MVREDKIHSTKKALETASGAVDLDSLLATIDELKARAYELAGNDNSSALDMRRLVGSDFLANASALLARLYDIPLIELGERANTLRRSLHGDEVYFNINRHINPSNICADVCKFCAFSASRKNKNPYEMSIDEILAITQESVAKGIKEVHIVSAHNPNYAYSWYLDMFSAVRDAYPSIHIKAMTAAEVYYLHKKFDKSIDTVLDDMIEAGVDSMPGGGAEIFDDALRHKICRDKVDSTTWLDIHQRWHALGHDSNATMLFGHIESRAQRIAHMLLLSLGQSCSKSLGKYNAFIPLVYQRANNFLKVKDFLSANEILKTIAISRLLLDNIPNIKAYWATLGLNLALVANEFGANDLDGTIQKESIQSAGGAKSGGGLGLEEMLYKIKDAGFVPVERDSVYNVIKVYR